MQSKQSLEDWYKELDPWAYESTDDDAIRKSIILEYLTFLGPFERALDIGCGEGFITIDLPANKIEGMEMSDLAAQRLPSNVDRVWHPTGKYDLIVATGILYEQYDWQEFNRIIKKHASGYVLTSNIKSWERNTLPEKKQVVYDEFPYREYVQAFRIYKW